MKIKIGSILLVLIAVLVAIGIVVAHRANEIRSAFREAHNGEPQRLILDRLGQPWREAPCGQTFGGTAPSACSQEMIYRHPLAPVVPEYWSFQYDSKKQLVDTYEWTSP